MHQMDCYAILFSWSTYYKQSRDLQNILIKNFLKNIPLIFELTITFGGYTFSVSQYFVGIQYQLYLGFILSSITLCVNFFVRNRLFSLLPFIQCFLKIVSYGCDFSLIDDFFILNVFDNDNLSRFTDNVINFNEGNTFCL